MQRTIDQLCQYYCRQGPVVLLESQLGDHPAGNCSYLAALPDATITARDRQVEVKENGCKQTVEANPWEIVSQYYKKWGSWLFGYLGYDLKNHVEVLDSQNPDVVGAPDLFLMRPRVLLQIDQNHGAVNAIKGDIPEHLTAPKKAQGIEISGIQSTVTEDEYISMIRRAKHDIYEGQYYEINCSHQLQARFRGAPFELYRQMRRAGPVPFGAFMQFDDISICCSSPERFLSKRGDTVFSQPIKGTMQRDEEQWKDDELKQMLLDSSKNRAENLMIVDLVRNDLSRIAKQGSVQVSDLFEIQTFDTVHQMVSTIKAKTAVCNPLEIIKACYPMGSMTGAPKVRVMQAIEELENYRRGIYSGAIGYLTPAGDFDFNVVIRTAIIKEHLLCYAVGGAITSDSDPQEEWQETWLKAKALLNVFDKKEAG